MSRIGNRIITIPDGVTARVEDNKVTVKGPKGELSTTLGEKLTVTVKENQITVERLDDTVKKFHGTANANIVNMINGVTKGYKKELEAVGVGYKFTLKGNVLDVAAGYSHHIELAIPEGITLECPSNTEVNVLGIDKEKVGQFAAEIRKIRKPEPYKGKGIRYKDEFIRRKEGKKASK